MHDLREHDVEMLTIGQYLQPSIGHLPVMRYVPPEGFEEFERAAFEWALVMLPAVRWCAPATMLTSRRTRQA